MWIDYMRAALKDMPESEPPLPPGLVTVRIDPSTGAVAGVGNRNAILETFRAQDVPKAGPAAPSAPVGYSDPRATDTETLF
jgi:penicillin-binding protein 1A